MADPFAIDKALVEGASQGAWFVPMHPSGGQYGDPPLRILIAGMDSETFKRADEEYQDRQMAKVLRAGVPRVEDVSVLDRNRELLAACTIQWENIEDRGAPLPLTKENALRLYQCSHIYDQAITFMRDRRNFYDPDAAAQYALPLNKAEALEASQKKQLNGQGGVSVSSGEAQTAAMPLT